MFKLCLNGRWPRSILLLSSLDKAHLSQCSLSLCSFYLSHMHNLLHIIVRLRSRLNRAFPKANKLIVTYETLFNIKPTSKNWFKVVQVSNSSLSYQGIVRLTPFKPLVTTLIIIRTKPEKYFKFDMVPSPSYGDKCPISRDPLKMASTKAPPLTL